MNNPPAQWIGTSLLLAVLTGCAATPKTHAPGEPLGREGDEIVAAGRFFHTGAPVVLWLDPGGYDAYRTHRKFSPEEELPSRPAGAGLPNRYGTLRRHVSESMRDKVFKEGWSLPELQEYVDLFVLHYDVCGTSRQCFKVLHDIRGLSVHFMLDVDGTIYQTLDLKERAWHAGTANDRSIGIEIANIGAYKDMETLDKWYGHDDEGPYITFPNWMKDTGIRTEGFVARPARPEPVRGRINGLDLVQYDLTPEQYDSLIRLTATLCRVFPKIKPDCPRDADGNIVMHVLPDAEIESFSGILGHFHVTQRKQDPGPAFNWEMLIEEVSSQLGDDFEASGGQVASATNPY